MTLERYLKHRSRYEFVTAFLLLLLFGVVNATTLIIERIREQEPTRWISAFATELSATLVIIVLIPLVSWFIQTLNLNWSNARWRVLWHIPGWIAFNLLHIGLFVAVRKLMWASIGDTYVFGDLWLGLLYEMRKGLIVYLAIVLILHTYWFVLDRLQGQADVIDSESESASDYPEQFVVKMLNRQFLVKAASVDWVQSASNYVILHCAERSYPMRQTMTAVAGQLDPQHFVRVHRTAYVNVNSVQVLKEGADAHVELLTGTQVPVSKTYLQDLKHALSFHP